MSDNLVEKMVVFCRRLRSEHGFSVGPRETREALRAIETVGLPERARVAAALRTVLCSRPQEIEIFDREFAAFFSTQPLGVAQPQHAQRNRLARDRADAAESQRGASQHTPAGDGPPEEIAGGALRPSAQPDAPSLGEAWQGMRARYSPAAAGAQPPVIPSVGLDVAYAEANRLVKRLELGRSLRWKPQPHGERFDLRRTLRAGLRTGGEAIVPRMLGHPLRNPRFVLLLDGSRSMSENAERMLQFAHALCRRTRRASAFLFSTELREITRELRAAGRGVPYRFEDLGEAWGGGTRIGASLTQFVRRYGARLSDQTFVIVVSDGLDVGDIPQLRRAMHEIARRSAAIAWVNPHADKPGYVPSAHGMQAALPFVATLTSLDDLDALTNLGRRARMPVSA